MNCYSNMDCYPGTVCVNGECNNACPPGYRYDLVMLECRPRVDYSEVSATEEEKKLATLVAIRLDHANEGISNK